MRSSMLRIVLLSGILCVTLLSPTFSLPSAVSAQSGDGTVDWVEWETYTDDAGNPLYVPSYVDATDDVTQDLLDFLARWPLAGAQQRQHGPAGRRLEDLD